MQLFLPRELSSQDVEFFVWCCSAEPAQAAVLREWGTKVLAAQQTWRAELFRGFDERAQGAVDDLHAPSAEGRSRFVGLWKDRDRAVAAYVDREMQLLTECLVGQGASQRGEDAAEFVAWVRTVREVDSMPSCLMYPRAKPDLVRLMWRTWDVLRFADADAERTAKLIVLDAAPRLMELRRLALRSRLRESSKGLDLALVDEDERLRQRAMGARPGLGAESRLAELQRDLIESIATTLSPEASAAIRSAFLAAAYGSLARSVFSTDEVREDLLRSVPEAKRERALAVLNEDAERRRKALDAFLVELDRNVAGVLRTMIKDERTGGAVRSAMTNWHEQSRASALSAIHAIESLTETDSPDTRAAIARSVDDWVKSSERDAASQYRAAILTLVGAGDR